jgi:hypothetical protein
LIISSQYNGRYSESSIGEKAQELLARHLWHLQISDQTVRYLKL